MPERKGRESWLPLLRVLLRPLFVTHYARRSTIGRAMEISKYDIEERAKYVAEARDTAFLDAIFLINYYNRDRKRWGFGPKPEDITPQEVFSEFDENAYEDALRKSQKLLAENGLVGMAFFEYQSVTISYEDAAKKLRKENPGFSDKSYELAIHAGIRDMR
ncbi:putative integron gene cassette protein [Candidatus Moduliflexus flocculans]|uniref:Putative integron gene cassette protein n=1 Tax=Candidatus Moduliflexus flocculans TaxID=1499966 RepID=A0A0S6W0X5_9BACT|nr:putative integron gene cassette protein [Candidatus Moduliflexus flocculans]